MKFLIVFGSIVVPVAMLMIQRKWIKWRIVFNVTSVLSTLILGNISALAIYEILRDNTVFMTSIHAIFLNPMFLLTGAYLGVYLVYRLMLMTYEEVYV
ncbi:transposase [Paenibacillus odorifer]|uniref:Transposase n=1 Tax=Paenibacillus odorifer TaxID=189426 RepID=A0A1R0ZBG6_9BACL|nr:transposase [Paenibacillus odorifer]OMD48625.1 transposase [Paenibacillus odorifer]OME66110.1 transposase [Paenibacillus odorifer]